LIYLSGAQHPDLPPSVGRMHTPMMGNRVELGTVWAADTGCFGAPEKHTDDGYLRWLAARAAHAGRCLFATAPDVVGDAAATLERSAPMLPRVRGAGFRAALVAQDGLESLDVPWDAFDALFVGGTTGWKLSEAAYRLVAEAKRRGKWAHMGRVNSWPRLRAAALSGYDSADGTFLAFGPDKNLPRLAGWLGRLERQPALW
jgi:hypothetical protein